MVNWEQVINELKLPDLPSLAVKTRSSGTELYISVGEGGWKKLEDVDVANGSFEWSKDPLRRPGLGDYIL